MRFPASIIGRVTQRTSIPLCAVALCLENSQPRRPAGPVGEAPLVTRPGQVVSVDLMALPATPRGSEYLLLAVDHASRYVCAAALRDKASKTVARALEKELFDNPLLGPPSVLLSDQGREFDGAVAELCQRFGVRQSRTLAANPAANGIVERANRTALGVLRALDAAGGH